MQENKIPLKIPIYQVIKDIVDNSSRDDKMVDAIINLEKKVVSVNGKTIGSLTNEQIYSLNRHLNNSVDIQISTHGILETSPIASCSEDIEKEARTEPCNRHERRKYKKLGHI